MPFAGEHAMKAISSRCWINQWRLAHFCTFAPVASLSLKFCRRVTRFDESQCAAAGTYHPQSEVVPRKNEKRLNQGGTLILDYPQCFFAGEINRACSKKAWLACFRWRRRRAGETRLILTNSCVLVLGKILAQSLRRAGPSGFNTFL